VVDDEQPDLSAFDGGERSDADGGSTTATDPESAREAESEMDEIDPGVVTTDPGTDETDSDDVDPGDERVVNPDRGEHVAELDRDERVELGVELLEHVEAASLPLSEAVDRIETVTTDPALTREILDTAELRGVIEREGGRLRTRRGGTFVRFEQDIVRREGDYECRRCGAGLSTGHFVRFDTGELGPFGPACVKKILGRS
jgi:hypothetical protein